MLSEVPDLFNSDSLPSMMSPLSDSAADSVQDGTLNEVVDGILEDVMFGFALEVHRMVKFGVFEIEDTDPEYSKQFEIVDAPGVDVFGQELKKKPMECVCPNCDRNMAASRFAPHLEKCMGMGRCSSRVASRRIANNINKQDGSDNDSMGGDADNDNDWGAYKRTKKIKREKHNNSPKGRGKASSKLRTEVVGSLSSSHVLIDGMDQLERRTLLDNVCGAIIDDSNSKVCTRSRCTTHTDEQRILSRRQHLLEPPSKAQAPVSLLDDDIHVDIDTCDDIIDNQSLRDALWEKELTPSGSPADSTCTVNSNGSRKHTKRKGRKHDKY